MTRPPTRRDDRSFGVYLHIPFCAHRCDYCAFATWADRPHLVFSYLAALEREILTELGSGTAPAPATSVFVGGGTPSLVDPAALASLLRQVPLASGAEVTVECNPESVTDRHAQEYVSAGVNRVSLGVQSMVPSVLLSLGRRHDPGAVRRAVEVLRANGIDNINLDVIYGAAGESLEEWRTTLDHVVELEPDHVSAYALTVEAGTPLASAPDRHPDDDDQAAKYEIASGVLERAGYRWYEISNWARPGRECQHNLLYWAQGDYRGFGCAAHSHARGRRWWNVRTPERYIDAVARGEDVEAGAEELDDEVRRVEALQLSLRTRTGVPTDALSDEDADLLSELIERADDRFVLSPAGRLMANEVAVRLRAVSTVDRRHRLTGRAGNGGRTNT